MSDIAMLVAEEYERRVKHSRKAAGGEGDMAIHRLSCASVMFQRIKRKMGKEKTELLKMALEPESSLPELEFRFGEICTLFSTFSRSKC
ncbi:hypothetical protein NC653_013299 [Populus alba x Populus x berolinensis]|uniref:Uncharacterized protein n=1 Tax=Populus alba x Populus x berolinensis TaxID=444605 RepID=A0AAD6QUJ1_9ROSI|nr:hypothetical protein NC653_013299 [Populus alba x Populus x berolinensis]